MFKSYGVGGGWVLAHVILVSAQVLDLAVHLVNFFGWVSQGDHSVLRHCYF